MDLLATFLNFVEDNNGGERAAFEAAMEERIRTSGYKMSDLIYELFCVQKNMSLTIVKVGQLEEDVARLQAKLNKKKVG